jgi:hypothetical protein
MLLANKNAVIYGRWVHRGRGRPDLRQRHHSGTFLSDMAPASMTTQRQKENQRDG